MKKINNVLVALFLFTIIIFLAFEKNISGNISLFQIILFGIIGVISVKNIISQVNEAAYSLNIMFWLFNFFFFFIAPVVQIIFEYHPWGIILSNEDIEHTCYAIIIWMVSYKIGNFLIREKNNSLNENYKNIKINKNMLYFLNVLSIISCLIIIKNVGLSNLFSRATSALTFGGDNSQMMSLITGHCTKAIIVFSVIVSIIYYQQEKKGELNLLLNLFILLLVCFPTALARNTAGTIYMGIGVILFYKKFKKVPNSLAYICFFIIAFLILFPAINAFRNLDFKEVNTIETIGQVVGNIGESYLAGDYDAFSMVSNVRNYVKINGLSYGKQFLGGILFFIPRTIWASKPIGSGSMIFTSLGKEFTNVSCPLIAEVYLNWGYVGNIIFGIILGSICSFLDKKYWLNVKMENNRYLYFNLLYPFLLPLFFFMLRGDFMSTWSYACVYIFIFYILYKIIKINIHF